jgi:hypothetical protein
VTRVGLLSFGTCALPLVMTSMDYQERSSVWKTHRFLAASCRITETSSLAYIWSCPSSLRLILTT